MSTPTIDRVAAALRAKPYTAKQLAADLGCSLPTVYLRLAALERRGDPLLKVVAHRKVSGPRPTTYSIRD
jgi:predicted ArsR family transcriptional regulator